VLKVLLVDDDVEYLDELKTEVFQRNGFPRVEIREVHDGASAVDQLKRFRPDLVLVDMIFPLEPHAYPAIDAGVMVIEEAQRLLPSTRVVALSSRDRDFAVKLLTSRRIADFLFKDQSWNEIAARILGHVEAAGTTRRTAVLTDQLERHDEGRQLVARDEAMLSVVERLDHVAATDTTVLLLGESGTGKEVLARRLHARSDRAASAFVAVNCGALDEHLVGSELFGHVKGAFTGAAADRTGKFELAHGGTLFLDEVGELSPANQVRLLRVIEERTFERVGGVDPIECDVRLVAATNRSLDAMVAGGEFRQDLFFRLNVFAVTVPPLRERPLDVPALVAHYVQSFARRRGKHVSSVATEAMAILQTYSWPGNVRQLRNTIEHAVILEQGSVLSLASLPPLTGAGRDESHRDTWQPGQTYREALARYESVFLGQVLRHHDGDTKAAADALDLPLRTLQSRLKRLGLKATVFRGES